jgi:hypothetical protein
LQIRVPAIECVTVIMKGSTKLRRKRRLPRAPLPRQVERAHEDKTKRPVRKQKHRKPSSDDD